MKTAIIIFLITQTIAFYEAKPLDSLEVIEETTTPSSFEVRESGTVPVEVVKDAVTETKSSENTKQVTENVRIERSTINEIHLSDGLEFNLGGNTRVADEEMFSDIDSITLSDTSKAAEEVTTAAIDEETARKIDDESDIVPKEAEDSAEQLDTDVKTAAVNPEKVVKAASEQSSVVDEEETVEKAGEEESSLLEADSEEDPTRRLLGHKIIDTKARSGYEVTADDVGHVQVTEDEDVSSEARSAIPLDSRRPFSPLPSIFTQPLVPLLRPNLLLKPLLTVVPSIITPPIQQDIFKPFPKMFQNQQQLQSQTPPKQLYQPQNHNSYPYSPTTTAAPPVVQNNMHNLLSSSNFDQIFFKLSQASRAAQPLGYQYSNVVRTSSPVTSYQFSVPGFAQYTA